MDCRSKGDDRRWTVKAKAEATVEWCDVSRQISQAEGTGIEPDAMFRTCEVRPHTAHLEPVTPCREEKFSELG
jgi:hypothetical protein